MVHSSRGRRSDGRIKCSSRQQGRRHVAAARAVAGGGHDRDEAAAAADRHGEAVGAALQVRPEFGREGAGHLQRQKTWGRTNSGFRFFESTVKALFEPELANNVFFLFTLHLNTVLCRITS